MCTSRLLKKWTNNLSNTTLPRTAINRWMNYSAISRDKLSRVTRVIKRAFSAISMILNLKCKNMTNGSNKLDWIWIKTKTQNFLSRQIWLSTMWKYNLKLQKEKTLWRNKTWTLFNKCWTTRKKSWLKSQSPRPLTTTTMIVSDRLWSIKHWQVFMCSTNTSQYWILLKTTTWQSQENNRESPVQTRDSLLLIPLRWQRP